MYSITNSRSLFIDHRNKEKLHSLLIAEELWRVSLLKYYTPEGKHSSAHTTIMTHHSSCRLT